MSWPNESDEYRQARDELLEAEIELRRQEEAVAARRRALPLGGEVTGDYVFDSPSGPVTWLARLAPVSSRTVSYGQRIAPSAARYPAIPLTFQR